MTDGGAILGLDIGSVRTGIAISRPPVYIASPFMTVPTEKLPNELQKIITGENVRRMVAGLPRNMSGEPTVQTAFVESEVTKLQEVVEFPIAYIDEAATSVKAQAELDARKKPYIKEDVDMLAATYILEDYMREHPEVTRV